MNKPDENELRDKLGEIEAQMERSGLFSHTALSRQAERINEIESFLYGLIDTLNAKGLVEMDMLKEAVKRVREETISKKEHFHIGVGIRVDQEEEQAGEPVNCQERLHIYQAVCCKLNFTLSVDEIESGTAKWDLGMPYFIRHNKAGYCTHIDSEKKCCSIYNDRPKVCQKYSCKNDERIWKDFDKMELNSEWIETNLKPWKMKLKGLYMIPETPS
jgi:Fe-S-cluster containining protein